MILQIIVKEIPLALSKSMLMKTLVLTLLLLTVCVVPVLAGDTVVNIPIWPGLAPNETTIATGDTYVDPNSGQTLIQNVTSPRLYVYLLPDGKPHPAVLIFPGGAYQFLSKDNEGVQIAEWLNKQGFVAAILYYRVPGKRDAAFQDAQRSLSLLRARATEFAIDPGHVGVIGFSAGGHLAARLSANFGTRSYPAVDISDRQSSRPDFTALIYPAYLVDKNTGVVAPEVQPVWNSPPTFLAQTKQDPYYDLEPYSAALLATAIPVKTLSYEGGGHGYGLYPDPSQPVAKWPSEAEAWLAQQVKTTQP